MNFFEAIIIGFVQGVGEFLPISSSGHLVLFNQIFSTNADFLFFSVMLHFASLFAVLFVLKKEVLYLVKNPFSALSLKLCLATLPTVVIVLCFKAFFENAFGGAYLPVCFMITAVLLFLTELFSQKKSSKKLTKKSALLVGIAQGLAVLPGISRSGATISAALLCGVGRENASKFSFLLSVPIILSSVLFEIIDGISLNKPLFDVGIGQTLIAFVAAFVVGVISVKFMLKTFQKIKLWWFSIYLAGLSIFSFFIT